jgi:hypothetical protein
MAPTRPTTPRTRRWRCAVTTLLVGLSLTGLNPAEASSPSPLRLQPWPSGDFGYVLLGQSVVQKFTVRNAGNRPTGPLEVTVRGSDTLRAPARRDHCRGQSLRPGFTCKITVVYTPERHYDATLSRFVSEAHGRLVVSSTRRSGWVAAKRLSGEGDTEATRLARPFCTSFAGTLTFGQIQDAWLCTWSYADESEYDGRRGVLQTVCNLGGAITLSTPPYSDTETTTTSLCTSAGA